MTLGDRLRGHVTIVAATLTLASLGAPGRARAEVGPQSGCWASIVLPDPGNIPRWQRVVFFAATDARFDPSRASVSVVASDGGETPLPLVAEPADLADGSFSGALFELPEPLERGTELLLRHQGCPIGSLADVESRFHVTGDAPEPPELGTLSISDVYAANAERGVEHRVHFVVVELSPELWLRTWSRILRLDARSGDESLGPEQPFFADRVASWRREIACPPSMDALETHTVEVTAAVGLSPDRRFRETTATRTVQCAGALRVNYDTLEPLSDAEAEWWDRTGDPPPAPDGGSPSLDAAVPIDARPPPPLDASPDDVDGSYSEGCGCRVPAGHPRAPAVAVLALVVMLRVRDARGGRRASRRSARRCRR